MQNTGSNAIGAGDQIVFRSGNRIGAPEAVGVPAAAPGQYFDVSVTWQIPTSTPPGTYKAVWQLRNPQGTYYGDEVWFNLKVSNSQSSGGNSVNVEIVGVENPEYVTPGQKFWPQVTVRVKSGQLRESSGHMLLHKSGTRYNNHPHVMVRGVVDNEQTHTFRFYNEHPLVAPQSEGVYETRYQVWANNGWVGPEVIIRFSVFESGSSRRPNAPSLTSPNNWAVLVGQTPTLCVQHNGDPDGDAITHYRFVIYDSAQNYDSGWVSNNCVQPQGLGNFGYKWHAQVRDSRNSESHWSEDRYFNIESSTVTITQTSFDPPSPSGASPIIMYAATSGCAGLGVGLKALVNTATDGSANGEWKVIKELGVPKFTEPDAPRWDTLEYAEGTHLTRIEATSCDGTIVVKEQPYTLLRGRPSRPYRMSPSDGWWSDSRTITFRWRESMRANNYTLVVGTTPNPEQAPVLNITLDATEYIATFDQDYPRLYWTVYANNEHGRTDQGGWWVGIDQTQPTSSVNTTRTTALSYENHFPVSWDGDDDASGVQSFDIQVRVETDGAWTNWLASYPNTSAIFTGQPGRKYCFRTRAYDIAGNVEPYAADADACVTINPSQRPPQVWWDTAYTLKHAVVVANRQGDRALPAGYPIQIHFDTTTTPTAAEVYEASLAPIKGNDLRIVYQPGTEVPRVITSFSPSLIDIWFPAHVEIGPSESSSAYALYIGNDQAADPNYTAQQVFVPDGDANTVLLMHLDDGSGGTATDLSGQGNNGVLQGSFPQPWAAGKVRSGLQFGGNSLVRVEDSASLRLANSVTVEAWVRLAAPGGELDGHTRNIVSKMAPGVGGAFRLFTRDRGHLIFDIMSHGAEGRVESPTRLVKDRWYHVAGVYDGSHIRLFVDGVEVRSTPYNKPMHNSSAWLALGSTGYQQEFFVGDIDQVRISNVARTSFPHARVVTDPSAAVGEQQTREARGKADLAFRDLEVTHQSDGSYHVQVIIDNLSPFPADKEFFVDLYGGEVPTESGDRSGSVGFWVNAPIAPSSTLTLTKVITEGMLVQSSVARHLASMQTTPVERTYTVAVQADSMNVMQEEDEANNAGEGASMCFTDADRYEGDSSSEQARLVTMGTTESHNIHQSGDEDWVRFVAHKGVSYSLRTFNLHQSADTHLYLYGPDRTTLLATNDDDAGTLASRIEWVAPKGDTYYLQVRDWNPGTGGCGTSYDLSLSAKGDDRSYGVQFQGWYSGFHKSALGGGYLYANVAGQSLSYSTAISTTAISLITYRGPDQGQARIYIDGVDRGIIDLYAPRPTYQVIQTYTGLRQRTHTLVVSVLDQKNDASTGTSVRVDGFRVGTTMSDDTSDTIRYGNWESLVTPKADGGSLRRSSTPGDTVTFTFSGTQFTWITLRAPSYGIAQIIVDGRVHSTVDLYKPNNQWQYSHIVSGLTNRSHTVQIKVLGTRNPNSSNHLVVFDGFRAP